jgi:hypothetical protein
MAEKVWEAHLVNKGENGEPDLLYVDLHLIHEVTSPQAFDGLRIAGRQVRRPDLTLATEDHNVPTLDVLAPIADEVSRTQVETLRGNCAEFGVTLYPMNHAEQGIVHVVGPQLGLTQPGMTVVCGDSHTSTHGAFGAIAFGIGTSQVRDVLAWLRDIPWRAATRRLCHAIETWDGNYNAQSPGANAFELLFFHLARGMVSTEYRTAYEAAWGTRALTWEDIMAAPARIRLQALRRAARKAAGDFKRRTMWGERHRLRLAHPFGLIPVIGRNYRFADLPASGTSETLMKTAHGLTNRRHSASYGSVARHISDLSDPDANYFALLGGQDGCFGSANFTDQVALWQRGEYVALPLRASSAAKSFRHRTVFLPGQSL